MQNAMQKEYVPDPLKFYKGRWAILGVWEGGRGLGRRRYNSERAANRRITELKMQYELTKLQGGGFQVIFEGPIAVMWEEIKFTTPIPVREEA